MADILSALNPFAAGAEALGGLIKIGVGIGQRAKGNKLLKEANTEDLANQAEFKKNASIGLPSEQYNQAMKNIQRQQLFAMRSAGDRRSGLALLPTIQDATNTAIGNLDVTNAQARMANQNKLLSYNVNKFLRDREYALGVKGMGNQNLFGGVDQFAAGGLQFGGSLGNGSNGYGNSVSRSADTYSSPHR
jgi:hypothetical protein